LQQPVPRSRSTQAIRQPCISALDRRIAHVDPTSEVGQLFGDQRIDGSKFVRALVPLDQGGIGSRL